MDGGPPHGHSGWRAGEEGVMLQTSLEESSSQHGQESHSQPGFHIFEHLQLQG